MGWFDQYYRINKVVGVAIELLSSGEQHISTCFIEAASNELNIGQKLVGISSVNGLPDKIANSVPIALAISGKGVLHKQLPGADISDQDAFAQAMPNADETDFYIQRFSTPEATFISLIRKSEADKWIGALLQAGYTILSLSLGPFPVYQIQSVLNFYDEEVRFGGYVIRRNSLKEWQSVKIDHSANAVFSVKLENEAIDEYLLVPYAAAFQLVLADKISMIAANKPELQTALDNLLNKIKLRANGAIVLCIFFLLLLVNFITLSVLDKANDKLTQQTSTSSQNISDVQQSYNQIKKRQLLVSALGWDGGIHKNGLIDQIASLLPDDISWNQIDVNPVDQQQSRDRKMPVFDDRRIRISGISQKVIPVNEWMARIKTRRWVKDVQLENYSWNNELNTGQFTIIINY